MVSFMRSETVRFRFSISVLLINKTVLLRLYRISHNIHLLNPDLISV